MQELNLTPVNIPRIDASHTTFLDNSVVKGIEEDNRRMNDNLAKAGKEAAENRRRLQEAVERTANNTEEANSKLQRIIEQQSDHIDLLKETKERLEEQIEVQKCQLELTERQLQTLQNIFASSEDGVIVEKEIMKLIEEQIDSNHPLWEYVKDKGGDAFVAYGIPVMYNAFKAFLISKGFQVT